MFDYKDFESWGDTLIAESVDILTSVIIEAMQRDPESIGCSSNILSWLDDRVFEESGRSHASATLQERLRRRYSYLRLYHGTRVESLSGFMKHGLLPGTVERVEQLARDVFGNGKFPRVTHEVLNSIFIELRPSVEDQKGQVFFCIDDRHFNNAGQYLTYGAEYLGWVAALLQKRDGYGNDEYHAYLRARGAPTVFIVDYPIADLPSRYDSLWTDTLKNLLWKIADRNDEWESPDYSITLPCVHPSLISGHYHPSRTRDPIDGFDFRENPFLTCDHCSGRHSIR